MLAYNTLNNFNGQLVGPKYAYYKKKTESQESNHN